MYTQYIQELIHNKTTPGTMLFQNTISVWALSFFCPAELCVLQGCGLDLDTPPATDDTVVAGFVNH